MNAAPSAFLDLTYCSQLLYRETADACQPFRTVLTIALSGKSAITSSLGLESAVCWNSVRSRVALGSKYPCGMVGYVSLSWRRNLLMSLRYSLSKVCALYSGCPWKWTNRLFFFLFTNESTPASEDLVSTT